MPKQTLEFTDEDKEILDMLKHKTGMSYVGLVRKMIRHYADGGDIHGLIGIKEAGRL